LSLSFIAGNGLDGTIPGELGLLLAMSHLSLFNNNLEGKLPAQMMYLTDLKFMALEQNAITGELPAWLTQLSNMKFLALGGNKFTGTIPEALTAMTRLSELSLEENSLEGDIEILNRIPTLTRLFLGNNKFHGEIHSSFLRGLEVLRELDLSSNKFTGTLPLHFFDYEILDLHDNDLDGEIPSIPEVEYPIMYLLLHNNGFSGRLHSSIAYLTDLTRLDVSNNELTGTIPESIADMEDLEYLYLANNKWEAGPVPTWHNLTGLVELSLKGTNRVGRIPRWLGEEMRDLRLLSLDNNKLSGEIPETFGHMKRMEYLLLNQNNLTGEVPETLKHLHALSKYSYWGKRACFEPDTQLTFNSRVLQNQ
jgi:Leucine-rich repeat (LRR) protein